MALALVSVTGTLREPDKVTPQQGTVTFAPNGGILVDPASAQILVGSITVQLDAAGSFSVALPATDSTGVQPAANTWNWHASFNVVNATITPFNFALLTGTGPVDLTAVIQVAPLTGDYLVVPGPPGRSLHRYYGAGAPSTLHTDGDEYLRTDTGDLYVQASGAWGLVMNLRGPKGDKGDAGTSSGAVAAPPLMRSVRIVSDANTPLPDAAVWTVIVTSGAGALPPEPVQCSVPAVPGNRVRVWGSGMFVGAHYMDWVLLAADGSISQYAVNLGSSHPTRRGKEGGPGFYPSLSLSRMTPAPVFPVGAEHIDGSGHVTVALAHQGTGEHRLYAFEDNGTEISYPFDIMLENLDQTEAAPSP